MFTSLMHRATAVLATAMSVTVLASCGTGTEADGGSDDQPVSLVYAYDGLFTKPFGTIAAQLKSSSGLSVDLQLAGNSYDDTLSRLRNDLTAGHPPDITMVGLNQVRSLVDAGVAVPLAQFAEADKDFDLGQYSRSMLDLTTFDGKLYGMPNAVSTLVMYYNADIFKAAGLDPDSPPQTWEAVESAARKIVASKKAKYGHWSDFESTWTFENFLRSNGGSMMDSSEQQVTFNQAPGIEVLKFWRGMVQAGLMPAFGTDDGREAFFRSEVAMAVDSSSQVANYKRTAGFTLRTAMLPIPAGGKRQAAGAGNALVITAKDPERQKLAWQALKAFVGPEGSTTTTKATGYLPVNQYAATNDKYLAKFLVSDPTRTAVLEQGKTLVRWSSWPGERGPEIGKVLQDGVYRAVVGKQSAQQALDEAAKTAETLLP